MKNRMSKLPCTLALALAAGLTLSACEGPAPAQNETMEVEQVEEAAPVAEEEAAPVVAEVPEVKPDAVPNEALPPSEANSAESVQPESETLFY